MRADILAVFMALSTNKYLSYCYSQLQLHLMEICAVLSMEF